MYIMSREEEHSKIKVAKNVLKHIWILEFLKSDEIWPNTQVSTRQHSTRMHTSRLETVHASVSVATTRCYSGGGGVRSPNKQG